MDHRKGPDHYYGDVVATYQDSRASSPTWKVEQELVGKFLSEIRRGARCLDVPVGTGRFLPYYAQNGHEVTCVDLSGDMLAHSQQAAEKHRINPIFVQGTVFDLPFADGHFDAVICTRLLTWFDESQIHAALRELTRVASGPMLVTAHVWRRPMELCGNPRALWGLMRGKARQEARHRREEVFIRRHQLRRFMLAFERSSLRIHDESVIRQKATSRYMAWSLGSR